MSLRPFFACAPAVVLRSDRAREYQRRVAADGGQVFSMAAVEEAYDQAARWDLNPALTHWSSPQFGVRLAPDGTVSKRYCLFGHDAAPLVPGRHWTPVYAPGLPPQHLVGEADRAFVAPPFAWPGRTLDAVVTCTQTSYATTANYGFFLLFEGCPDWNVSASFAMGIDVTQGGHAAGVSNPLTLRTTNVVSPLGHPNSYALATNAHDATAPSVAFRYNTAPSPAPAPNNGWGSGAYDALPVYLGARGSNSAYYWAGTINDVFYTAQVLSDPARAWLENQRWRYDATLPRPGTTVPSTDARWQELAGQWATTAAPDQPLVRYAEPDQAGRCDIGFYGKRVVVEHGSFGPARGHLYVDDVAQTDFAVSSPGQTTEIVCATLDYHTLSLRQDPAEGPTARGILHIYAG